ncbi:Diphosphomevalonate decarboxylase [Smittium mucronatum]|uniref:diphosphomevalonate decarboxylase n=1 Tax=Smittium mucronatum TaxID=133383 RepID=A0A1R0H5X9_9FUNG|nr:Diphosphomevalonate decarboxylase [Smittium mucronatum]
MDQVAKRVPIVYNNVMGYESTVTSPVNIAVVKYWGKRNSELILPTNSSLSCTLSQDHLNTKTSIRASPSYTSDRLWLNGFEEDLYASARLTNCIRELRRLRKEKENELSSSDLASPENLEAAEHHVPPLSEWCIHVASENNFPTAAGLASSASGYAALVQALSNLYDLSISLTQLSMIARLGSGSACRSVYGGFVEWQAGILPSGEDSYAVSVAPETHWPTLQALILVVSDKKKSTPSTSGMSTTVKTSELFPIRISEVVPKRIIQMKEAILQRDFTKFALLTMKESNQFHAVCLDTYPPIFYMNDISRAIIKLVDLFNSQVDEITKKPKGIRVAYTFDAGPNAVIYAEKDVIKEFIELVMYFFPRGTGQTSNSFFPDPFGLLKSSCSGNGNPSTTPAEAHSHPKFENYTPIMTRYEPGSIRRIIHTTIGDGPRVLDHSQALFNEAGMPKRVKD